MAKRTVKKGSTTSATKKVTRKTGQTKSEVAAEKPAAKKQTTSTYKRGTLGQVIYNYFYSCEFVTKKDPNYEESLALAQKAMPDTKYNKAHYAWYKNKWKNMEKGEKTRKAGK